MKISCRENRRKDGATSEETARLFASQRYIKKEGKAEKEKETENQEDVFFPEKNCEIVSEVENLEEEEKKANTLRGKERKAAKSSLPKKYLY